MFLGIFKDVATFQGLFKGSARHGFNNEQLRNNLFVGIINLHRVYLFSVRNLISPAVHNMFPQLICFYLQLFKSKEKQHIKIHEKCNNSNVQPKNASYCSHVYLQCKDQLTPHVTCNFKQRSAVFKCLCLFL